MTHDIHPRPDEPTNPQPALYVDIKGEGVTDGMSAPPEPSRPQRHPRPQIEPGAPTGRAMDSETKQSQERRDEAPGSPIKDRRPTNPRGTKLRLPTSMTAPLRGAENAFNTTPLDRSLNLSLVPKPTVPGRQGPSAPRPRRLPVSVSRGALDRLV